MSKIYVKEATKSLGTLFPHLSEDCIKRTILQKQPQDVRDTSDDNDLVEGFVLLTELQDLVSQREYVEGETKLLNNKFHYLGKKIKLKHAREETTWACRITDPLLRVKWSKFLSRRLVEENNEENPDKENIPDKENSLTSTKSSLPAVTKQINSRVKVDDVKSKSPLRQIQSITVGQPSKTTPPMHLAINNACEESKNLKPISSKPAVNQSGFKPPGSSSPFGLLKHHETGDNMIGKKHSNDTTITFKAKDAVSTAEPTVRVVKIGTSPILKSKPPPRQSLQSPLQSKQSPVQPELHLKPIRPAVQPSLQVGHLKPIKECSGNTENIAPMLKKDDKVGPGPWPTDASKSKPVAQLARVLPQLFDIGDSNLASKVEHLIVDFPRFMYELNPDFVLGEHLRFCVWDVQDIPQAHLARGKILSYVRCLKVFDVSYILITTDHFQKFLMTQDEALSAVVASPETLCDSEVDVAFVWLGNKPTLDSRTFYLALSRAKEKLVCLGNVEKLKMCTGTHLEKLVTFAEQQGLVVALKTA